MSFFCWVKCIKITSHEVTMTSSGTLGEDRTKQIEKKMSLVMMTKTVMMEMEELEERLCWLQVDDDNDTDSPGHATEDTNLLCKENSDRYNDDRGEDAVVMIPILREAHMRCQCNDKTLVSESNSRGYSG